MTFNEMTGIIFNNRRDFAAKFLNVDLRPHQDLRITNFTNSNSNIRMEYSYPMLYQEPEKNEEYKSREYLSCTISQEIIVAWIDSLTNEGRV